MAEDAFPSTYRKYRLRHRPASEDDAPGLTVTTVLYDMESEAQRALGTLSTGTWVLEPVDLPILQPPEFHRPSATHAFLALARRAIPGPLPYRLAAAFGTGVAAAAILLVR